MPLTTLQQINIGRLCGLYSSNEFASGKLAGGLIDKRLPHLIHAVTQGLTWMNDLNDDTENLDKVGNYLISICRHQLKAQGILSIGGGGTVAPIGSGTGVVNDIDFIVSASTLIATGESSVLLDGTGGNPDLRGYNIDFYRNGVVQYTTPPALGTYYNWNRVTGLLQLLGDNSEALVDEQMRISPDSGTGSSSVSPSLAPSITVVPAQWADAITLNLQYIVDAGEVAIFVSGYNSNFLVAPTDFTYNGTGITMTDSSFNSANFPFTLIMKIN